MIIECGSKWEKAVFKYIGKAYGKCLYIYGYKKVWIF